MQDLPNDMPYISFHTVPFLDSLTLFPDKGKFRANLKQTLDNIPALITEMAKPMEELTTGLIQQPESSERC